ncbi:unnamed protein product [Symbiodinium natans]|uniref:Uncharacterized protein n=1 Tax=Symbiodinium natans TaxID=878477 RepID=A0A812UX72_9DINO|nr:unnamed protein product [Symbiodinium natans]
MLAGDFITHKTNLQAKLGYRYAGNSLLHRLQLTVLPFPALEEQAIPALKQGSSTGSAALLSTGQIYGDFFGAAVSWVFIANVLGFVGRLVTEREEKRKELFA